MQDGEAGRGGGAGRTGKGGGGEDGKHNHLFSPRVSFKVIRNNTGNFVVPAFGLVKHRVFHICLK